MQDTTIMMITTRKNAMHPPMIPHNSLCVNFEVRAPDEGPSGFSDVVEEEKVGGGVAEERTFHLINTETILL